ncbi:hypothetical protein ACX0GZ_07270 [Sphingomonas aestuarii]
MLQLDAQWRPGSFTKNFSWGRSHEGLRNLHEAIRVGFDGRIEPVSRTEFRRRISSLGRPDFIPLNFFLLNDIVDGESVVLIDELAYSALTRDHDKDFDALALLAFNTSYVGSWKGAEAWQKYPATWAFFYITERVATELKWDTASVNADDIERFIKSSPRYTGETSRKLATNLSYMFKVGGLSRLSDGKVTRLWADATFLVLDRVSAERHALNAELSVDDLIDGLNRSRFDRLSGIASLDRTLAIEPLCKLYAACGGINRWSVEYVHQRQQILIPHINQYLGSNEPWVMVDPLDATLSKAVPQACAMLARYVAGFEELGPPSDFDVESYVRNRTQDALAHLKALNINPKMSAEDLMKITRG